MTDFQVWTLTVAIVCVCGFVTVYKIARFAIDRALPPHPPRWEKSQ